MDENTLNDLLECSVCLERLNTSSKVLPCQHTFCRKCLEVILSSRKELRCPECRVLVSVKIDDLPPNVLLMRILEGLKSSTTTVTTTPEVLKNTKQAEEQQKRQQLSQLQQQKQLLQTQQHVDTKPQTAQQQLQHNNLGTTTTHMQRRCLLPHAYALYDFNSSEPSDLHFKKGDLILLKQKLDINWYVGHLNGVEGTFPSNYVQIIIPLSSPQCIALYDFKMGKNEEEGCLNFKKGAIIHVLRRVDENWAEGRVGNMIGIFPIAFVELNALAKQLLGNLSGRAPSTGNFVSNTINSVAGGEQQPSLTHQVKASNSSAQQSRNIPPIPLIDPTISPSSSSLSNTTSPSTSDSAGSNNRITTTTTTTNTNSSNASLNSISMPNSPQQSLPTTPQHYAHGSGSVRYRNSREKRHSLNALLSSGTSAAPSLSILQTNRHSAEILSIPSEELIVENNAPTYSQSQEISTQSNAAAVASPQTTVSCEQRQSGAMATSTRANVLKSSCAHSNVPPSLPWGYLALYPYKPLKADELELKKGCVYIVTERCLDGWFKGKNWQDISGVFPGNYVTPLRARDQKQLMHQWKFVPQSQPSSLTISHPTPTASIANCQQIGSTRNSNPPMPKHHIPPELPPRHGATICASVWTKPLSHTVEAFFNRSNATNKSLPTQNEMQSNEKPKDKESKSKDSSTSAAVSLMKRLTHIKSRAKSPASTSRNAVASATVQPPNHNNTSNNFGESSNQENAGENTNVNTTHLASLHPVHVRSGSCPSQLLQSLPLEQLNSQTRKNENLQKTQQHQTHQQAQPTIIHHGSERIKGPKERSRLQATRQSMDGTLRGGIYSNVSTNAPMLPFSIPNTLLFNPKCAQQHQIHQKIGNIISNSGEQEIYGTHHRKSNSLDANNMFIGASNIQQLVPPLPPPASAYVNPNIAAAITASATTKSNHNGRESRFRCIVPYPPNSDVELELHVGDIIYVQRKQKNGWYKGTHARTQKTGLFPASFVEPDL